MSSLIIPTELTGADQIIYDPQAPGGVARFYGWSVRETVGTAAATVTFHSGTDATGPIIAVVELPASESSTEELPGVQSSGGLFVEIVGTGTVEGAVYHG